MIKYSNDIKPSAIPQTADMIASKKLNGFLVPQAKITFTITNDIISKKTLIIKFNLLFFIVNKIK